MVLSNDWDSFTEELEALGRQIFSQLPTQTALLETTPFPGWAIRPVNPQAAPFGIHWEPGGAPVDFFFGRFTAIELDQGKGTAKDQQRRIREEIRRLADAVTAGRCEERFNLLSVTGFIFAGSAPYRVTHYFHFHPLRRLFNRWSKYEPY